MSGKAVLRQEVIARVRALPPARRALEEEAVTAAIQNRPEWHRAATILLYRSVAWELGTVGLANAAWRAGKRVLFPRQEDAVLRLHHVTGWHAFAPGPHGIPEPAAATPSVHPGEVELAIVPGVAWSADGGRLGRGGGHYDRLLPALRCPTWGVGFDVQLQPELPRENHDQGVSIVWTCASQHLLQM